MTTFHCASMEQEKDFQDAFQRVLFLENIFRCIPSQPISSTKISKRPKQQKAAIDVYMTSSELIVVPSEPVAAMPTETHVDEPMVDEQPTEDAQVVTKDTPDKHEMFDFDDIELVSSKLDPKEARRKEYLHKNPEGSRLSRARHALRAADHAQKVKFRALDEGEVDDVLDIEFESAMKRTQGEKVLDDPSAIRRSIRRDRSKKRQSAKRLSTRDRETKLRMAAKQEARTRSLKKHKDGKVSRMISRAGFEGKRGRRK
eukprot:gnl/Dysnectes_brevis/2413_a2863_2323.p1 GENE.gnl/Dysnectes_brevis/2413_a2863_2323~~gnl/Dysnectes_brevis/2413_a2863_2323.p1  ORF type:complete len:274 (+),score=45.00 gnl/Dysnectes_brevis/2413_a2863_2323:54-824(+)